MLLSSSSLQHNDLDHPLPSCSGIWCKTNIMYGELSVWFLSCKGQKLLMTLFVCTVCDPTSKFTIHPRDVHILHNHVIGQLKVYLILVHCCFRIH